MKMNALIRALVAAPLFITSAVAVEFSAVVANIV
jgi:hypothetical protein